MRDSLSRSKTESHQKFFPHFSQSILSTIFAKKEVNEKIYRRFSGPFSWDLVQNSIPSVHFTRPELEKTKPEEIENSPLMMMLQSSKCWFRIAGQNYSSILCPTIQSVSKTQTKRRKELLLLFIFFLSASGSVYLVSAHHFGTL